MPRPWLTKLLTPAFHECDMEVYRKYHHNVPHITNTEYSWMKMAEWILISDSSTVGRLSFDFLFPIYLPTPYLNIFSSRRFSSNIPNKSRYVIYLFDNEHFYFSVHVIPSSAGLLDGKLPESFPDRCPNTRLIRRDWLNKRLWHC